MIFNDVIFWVAILAPFLGFVLIDWQFRLPGWLRVSFVVVLSAVYYTQGPNADLVMMGAFVLINVIPATLLKLHRSALLLMAMANIVALFLVKGIYLHGVPLAISFVAFQIAALYITQLETKRYTTSPGGFLFFVSFFPQLAAGPILHWGRVERFYNNWVDGVNLKPDWRGALLFISIGMAKKTLVADELSRIVSGYQTGADEFTALSSLLFPILYGAYIYFDFSSYTDIATGVARLIGFRLPINFYSPYKADSPRQFWRRWHRTLHKFLKIDLGRILRFLTVQKGQMTLLLLFLFSGFWHGASAGFLIWAVLHFVLFIGFDHLKGSRLPKLLRHAVMFCAVNLIWVPFALGWDGTLEWAQGFSRLVSVTQNAWLLVMWSAFTTMFVLFLPNGYDILRYKKYTRIINGAFAIVLVSVCVLAFTSETVPAPFIYFQF